MQPSDALVHPALERAPAPCPSCALLLAPALLLCPRCRALVHRAELEKLARDADAASARGDRTEALTAYRHALRFLPADSKQYSQITGLIRALREQLDAGESATALAPSALPATPGAAEARSGWRPRRR